MGPTQIRHKLHNVSRVVQKWSQAATGRHFVRTSPSSAFAVLSTAVAIAQPAIVNTNTTNTTVICHSHTRSRPRCHTLHF